MYLFYTFNKYGSCAIGSPAANRVSRFVLGDDDLIDPSSETVLIDDIPSPAGGGHISGDVRFGKDGYLYVTTGDGVCDFRGDSGCGVLNDAARDLGGLMGKVLRVTRNGNIPAGNPFTGADSDRCNATGFTAVNRKCKEVYSWGLRNPFRIGFDVNAPSTRFFINDVGQTTWEEIDPGGPFDYGWNVREGPCVRGSTTQCGPPPAGMTNPIHAYVHGGGCSSVTLGAFVPAGSWSPQYDGRYVFGDFVLERCGRLQTRAAAMWRRSLQPRVMV